MFIYLSACHKPLSIGDDVLEKVATGYVYERVTEGGETLVAHNGSAGVVGCHVCRC